MAEDLQKKLQKVIDLFTAVQKDYQQAVTQKQQLEGQLSENKAVCDELALLAASAKVYKLIGPIFLKQDLEEAKQNVAKRMEFIAKESKRNDECIASLNNQQDSLRETLSKLNENLSKIKLKA